MKNIVFTGPESTGKTTLAIRASERFGLKLVPEFSRSFLENNGPQYSYEDLLKIAKCQIESESQIEDSDDFQILDTDVLTLKIWSEYKFGKCDPFIETTVTSLKNRIYFLCKPDVAWVYDPLRESAEERDALFEIYQSELERLGFNYSIISGSYTKREAIVFNFLENLFGK